MSDEETQTAYYITPDGEKFQVTTPTYINALTRYVKDEGHGILVGKVSSGSTGIVPDRCHACGSSKIAIGTIMGKRFWTCSDCGTPGDL